MQSTKRPKTARTVRRSAKLFTLVNGILRYPIVELALEALVEKEMTAVLLCFCEKSQDPMVSISNLNGNT